MHSRFIILIATLLLPAIAFADGTATYHSEAGNAESLTIEADTQRAALWFRDGTWEITIQPSFPRDAGEAAWMVPFPVPPEVIPASADFLDALEKLTAPVFVQYCLKKTGASNSGFDGCGYEGSSGGGGNDGESGEAGDGSSAVTIWERGVADELTYAVLEASGADTLIDWLDEHGYLVPKSIEDEPTLLDDQVFFVAKLRGDLDPDAPLSPLTFRLPGVEREDVVYPLRLTATVAPSEGMHLLLWIITPFEEGREPYDPPSSGRFVPESHTWVQWGGGHSDMSRNEWEAARDHKIKAYLGSEGGLIHEYGGKVKDSSIYRKSSVHPDEYNAYGATVSAHDLDLDLPDEWPVEVDEIADGEYMLSRYRGVLSAAAMAQADLSFHVINGYGRLSNINWEEVSCNEISSAEEPERAPSPLHRWSGAAVLALVMLLSFAFLRRLR